MITKKCVICINKIHWVGKDLNVIADRSDALVFSNKRRAKKIATYLKNHRVKGVKILEVENG
jgi:hypothetical protein